MKSDSEFWKNGLPRLEAESIALRALRPEDAPGFFEVYGNEDVSRYWTGPPLANEEAAVAKIARSLELLGKGYQFEWAIVDRQSDAFLGTAILYDVASSHRRAGIGFAIGHRHWGRGLAGQATHCLLKFCFEELDLHRLEADVDPRNIRSLKLLKKMGFQVEAHHRQRWWIEGAPFDSYFVGLLRPEWVQP